MYLHHVSLWRWYIDDILMVWMSPSLDLKDFLRKLESNDFNLKCTYSMENTITFWDLCISIQSDGKLATSLCRKETAGNIILMANGAHLRALVKRSTYGQFIRISRNCLEVDFRREAAALRDRLLQQRYSKKTLKKACQKAMGNSCSELLINRPQRKQSKTA